MPEPSAVHFDAALTNLSIAYRNASLVSPLAAPQVGVRRQSNRYFVHDPGRDALRPSIDARAPGAEAREVGFDLSSDSYFCDDHALVASIPDEERDNADAPLQPEVDRVEFLTAKILLNQEIGLASILRDPARIPSTQITDAADKWSHEDADPLDAIEAARSAIVDAVQAAPNTLVLPFAAYQAVRMNPAVTGRTQFTRAGAFDASDLAALFDVDRVLVARAVANTAAEGQPPSLAPVWGNDAVLMHLPARAGLKTIAPVVRFVWTMAAGGLDGTSVQSWREERRKATMIRVQKYYDQKLTAPGAAYLIRDVV